MSEYHDDRDQRTFRDTVRGIREMLARLIVIDDQLGAHVRHELGDLALAIHAEGVEAVRLRLGDEAFDEMVRDFASVVAYHRQVMELRDGMASTVVSGLPMLDAMDAYAPPVDDDDD